MISLKNNKMRWLISGVFSLLILFGTYRNVFSLAAFLGCCLMIFFFDKESILVQMVFIMPLANIFKLSPGTQSFFTILLLLYVVLHLVLPRKATTLAILFAVYVIVGELLGGQFNTTRTIKLICNILFLSSIMNGKVDLSHKDVFLSYIVGNYVASFLGTLNSNFFKIKAYTGVEAFTNEGLGEDAERFIGLHSDPNFYAVNVIVSLCLVILLLHRNEIKTLTALIFSVPFAYFLIQTYSKSAIIMAFVPIILVIYSFICKKKYIAVLVIMMALLIIVMLVLSGQIEPINVIIDRFMASETAEGGVDINSLTTGRFQLWVNYLEYIVKNIKVILFGDGIAADMIGGRVSHNTYIDIIYHLGIVGGVLFITLLGLILSQSAKQKIKRNILNYSVLFSVGVMYFFLGELFGYDLPFHIYLAFFALNTPFENVASFKQNQSAV